jgi:hypothetical protein
MTEQQPQLIYQIVLDTFVPPLTFYDEGGYLGMIQALDIYGKMAKAEIDGITGNLYVDPFTDLDDEMGTTNVTGDYTPLTSGSSIPGNPNVSIESGGVTYDTDNGKIIFNNPGQYIVNGSVIATYNNADLIDDAGIIEQDRCAKLYVKLYTAIGTALQWSNPWRWAIHNLRTTSSSYMFSRVYNVLSSGDYMEVWVDPGNVFMLDCSYTFDVQEMRKYDV